MPRPWLADYARLQGNVSLAKTQHRLFIAVSPGLEPWLALEMQGLGLKGSVVAGGIELRASTENLWRLHHQSRLAESIRVRLRSFRARHFADLTSGLARLPWHAYLSPTANPKVQVTCHRSRLWHSGAVAERTREVIDRRLGIAAADSAETANPQTVFVRIAGDIVQASIDCSGELLHRRGHRTSVGEAPLRETLAAAMVRMLNQEHTGQEITLWDPFCGSGCMSIEWVEHQLGLDAGRHRRFAFEAWPIHDAASYLHWLQDREPGTRQRVRAYGSDIDESVLKAARANAGRSEVESHCVWLHGDFEAIADSVPLGAAILTNPPYGIRLGRSSSFVNVLERFEALLSRRVDLRPVIALLPESVRPWQPKLPWQCLAKFHNGGLRVQALRLD